MDEIGLRGLHAKMIVKPRALAEVDNHLRKLAGDEAVLSHLRGNSYRLSRRSDLRAHLIGELLPRIINDAKVCQLVLRAREDFAIEGDVVERVRVNRLNGA
jgi:hypothetical protein